MASLEGDKRILVLGPLSGGSDELASRIQAEVNLRDELRDVQVQYENIAQRAVKAFFGSDPRQHVDLEKALSSLVDGRDLDRRGANTGTAEEIMMALSVVIGDRSQTPIAERPEAVVMFPEMHWEDRYSGYLAPPPRIVIGALCLAQNVPLFNANTINGVQGQPVIFGIQ